ncbi:hypothetical protein GCM10011391_02520 [Pullulanibacillus camelliae]|uniref:Capsule synthesis protein CapA domain-containing protein n=1 Tax=Pullulanibacillus camelliae TaxID=1707096 RepID=A0A8J2VJZ3_9BACL|nr:CapA family protein [Pullulanibacillus camelliae]GGE27594.1 hypothetical protein GCM10011391_02520 [Pullulanibacillus camelliae]
MESAMTFVATGDSFITRNLPHADQKHREIATLFSQADVCFTNLEVTTHHYEGIPSAVSGGAWAVASPRVLEDLKKYGINLIAWANNHTLDFSYGGLKATDKYLNDYGFIHAGVGSNLAEASRPKYIETRMGRVALISATSTFHETWRAGAQRPDSIGRPGINPLRFNVIYEVTPSEMEVLKSIADKTSINATQHLHARLGLSTSSDQPFFSFGSYTFKVGNKEGVITTPNNEDMRRITNAISEAKRQADYVIVSIHSHEMNGERLEEPADFIKTFSRNCIDKGANAVIGHGPHILRGIEIYKNAPIFYSLGNFIFQNDTMISQPADFYERYGLDDTHNVADLYDARTQKETKGFVTDKKVWSSLFVKWRVKSGKLIRLQLYPIELGFGKPRSQRGWPELSRSESILQEAQALSSPFGTNIHIMSGVGEVELH